MDTQLWTQKYFPTRFEEFVGNGELVKEVSNWALEWSKNRPQKPLLLFGPSGVGKTALAELTAKIMAWHLFESNASDFRSKDVVERVVGAASANASFTGSYRLVLLDEIDMIQKREDRGGMSAVLSILKEAKNPVILTANDIYENTQMAEIRNFCKKLEFKKPNYLSVARFLREVCEKEGVDFDQESIQLLAKNASGDIRSALLDLQTISSDSKKVMLSDIESIGVREREERVFSTVQKIFRSRTLADAGRARGATDADPDFLFRWIEENLPLEFKDPIERANAFSRLSRSDIFDGRIRIRQHYGFLRYRMELMTSGVGLCHEQPNHEFIMYKFPGLLRMLSASSGERNLKKSLAGKIGKKTHSSATEVLRSDLAYWFAFFESKPMAIRLAAEFNLSEEEIAFLVSAEPKAKKVQEIVEKARELSAFALLQKRKGVASPLGLSTEPIDEDSFSKKTKKSADEDSRTENAEPHRQTKLF